MGQASFQLSTGFNCVGFMANHSWAALSRFTVVCRAQQLLNLSWLSSSHPPPGSEAEVLAADSAQTLVLRSTAATLYLTRCPPLTIPGPLVCSPSPSRGGVVPAAPAPTIA